MINNLLYISVIFNYKGTYEEGMEKLVLAEDTSNIDMSSDGLRLQAKKKRRLKAKKYLSSSSDEDICYNNESNYVRQTPAKLLPVYPEIGDFVSSNQTFNIQKSVKDNITNNIVHEKNTYCTMSGSGG